MSKIIKKDKFVIHIPDEVLLDVKHRLANTRWPDEIPGSDWSYGASLTYMRDLANYWQAEYDWRKHESVINTFSHYRTTIDDIGIHFLYERGKGPKPMPLLISHGWPSSFVEMLKIIPMLTDPGRFGGNPAHSFDVIVPSLPGFGFSDRPLKPGYNVKKIAELWMQLMTNVLGYDKFCAHGGDWGSYITARLGYAYPDHLLGIHTNSIRATPLMPYPGTRPLSEAERLMLMKREKWLNTDASYWHMQSKTPQTPAYGLNDSPVGLAAWIVEKWRDWTDCDGNLESRFSKNELITNVMIYWVTQTINSSMRIYCENEHDAWVLQAGERINVPCGIASFPGEGTLREWGERFFNIQHWTEFDVGGHFPAIEEPELLAKDLQKFFFSLRS